MGFPAKKTASGRNEHKARAKSCYSPRRPSVNRRRTVCAAQKTTAKPIRYSFDFTSKLTRAGFLK
jgi:hypothetical protein